MSAHFAFLDCYAIDRYPVTWEQYRRFLAGNGQHTFCSREEPRAKDHAPVDLDEPAVNSPVVGIDWFDAFAYAGWAGKTLPTEAQWEKAALWNANHHYLQRYPWGDTFTSEHCNTAEAGLNGPVATMRFAQNLSPYAIGDAYGNVWEWCNDYYVGTYPIKGQWVRDPKGPEFGEARVLRGGSWLETNQDLTPICRTRAFPLSRGANTGFRCVKRIELDFS